MNIYKVTVFTALLTYIAGCAMPRAAASADSRSLSSVLSGEWVISRVGDINIEEEDSETPYLNFDTRTGRFYSSNGCNIINGDFAVTSPHTLKLSSVLSTMKACAGGKPYRQKISRILASGSAMTCKVTDSQAFTTLTLTDARDGSRLLTLTRHRLNYLDGMWRISAVGGEAVNATEADDENEANIFFDTQALRLHGNTGCNYFNGNIYIDPASPGALSFTGMAVTRMSCPKSALETRILVALEETVACKKLAPDTVALLDSAGNQILTIKRMK